MKCENCGSEIYIIKYDELKYDKNKKSLKIYKCKTCGKITIK